MGPAMDVGAERWLINAARRYFWRVKHVYDEVVDLIHEGYVCWYYVGDRYEFPRSLKPVQREYGRLMNLFKVTFVNRVHELAASGKDKSYNIVMSRLRDITGPDGDRLTEPQIAEFLLYRNNSDLGDSSEVDRFIIEASEPVRSVLQFLVSEEGQEKMRRPYRRRADGTRETANERILRNTKVVAKGDIRRTVKQYLLDSIHHRT